MKPTAEGYKRDKRARDGRAPLHTLYLTDDEARACLVALGEIAEEIDSYGLSESEQIAVSSADRKMRSAIQGRTR